MVVSDINPKQRFISLRFSVQLQLSIRLSLPLFGPSNDVSEFKLFVFSSNFVFLHFSNEIQVDRWRFMDFKSLGLRGVCTSIPHPLEMSSKLAAPLQINKLTN